MSWFQDFPKYIRSHATEWAVLGAGALLLLALALLLGRILAEWARRALVGMERKTLGQLIARLIRVASLIIGSVMALDHLGVDVKTLLAGVGVMGLAISFGAQSLVKDLISGFFLILDDAIRVGDTAKVGEVTGTVEGVTLRTTRVRAFNGQLFYVPNGQIGAVGNFNRDWTRAIVEVGVAYEQDVGRGLEVLQQVGEAWAADNPEVALAAPEAQGALGLEESSVTLRLVIKVKAGRHWAAEREIRRRLKAAFDEAGVEIPFPRRVLYERRGPSPQP